MARPLIILLAALLALLPLACGEKDEPGETTGTQAETTTTADAAETADEPAELPSGWKQETNEAAGFTVGVPPGWKVAPPRADRAASSPRPRG